MQPAHVQPAYVQPAYEQPAAEITVSPEFRRSSLSKPRFPASAPEQSVDITAAPQPGVGRLDHRNADDESDGDERDLETPHFNPYRLALLLVSLAALVAAGVSFGIAVTRQTTGFAATTFEQIFLFQVVSTAPEPLISAGILGVVLWIASGAFLGGVRRDD